MNKPDIQREIALWVIRLNCDDPVERIQIQQEFEQWKNKNSEHLEMIDEFHQFNEKMQNLSYQHQFDHQAVEQTFQAVEKNQHQILEIFGKTTFMLAGLSCIGYLFYLYFPLQYYTADYRTSTAQTRNIILEDGSNITLGAKSAIKLDYTATQRNIHLIQGDIYIDVAKDLSRPLIIHTDQAYFQALGTRFIVNHYATSSTLSMLHSKVKVTSLQTDQMQSKTLTIGEQIRVTNNGLEQTKIINPAVVEMAWQQQQIVANQLPLSDVLSRLNSYYKHYIMFDHDSLDKIKVTGVINTDQDIHATLRLLKTQYPQIDFIQFGEFVTYAKLK